jgi:hypothetical protein
MARDIDYAAIAVENAILEKFGGRAALPTLRVSAGDKTITVSEGERAIEGTRDHLLSFLRQADSVERLFELKKPAAKKPH